MTMKPKMLLVFLGVFSWQVCSPNFTTGPARPVAAPSQRPAPGFGPVPSQFLDRRFGVSGRSLSKIPARQGGSSKSISEDLQQGGLFVGYFFVQTGMAFLMKNVLSKVQVAKDLFGVPASFFVLGTQQTVSVSIMLLILGASRVIGKPFSIKKLERSKLPLVVALGFAFSLNTGFNLLAMSLIPLSLLMIIRACSPITTGFLQSVLLKDKKSDSISPPEWVCLAAGVVCAALVTWCESGGGGMGATGSHTFWIGVACAVTSLLLAGVDFVIKAKLGKLDMSALDTNFYQALPVVLVTLVVGSLLPTPVPSSWAAKYGSPLTDLTVFQRLFQVNPAVFFHWVAASGIAAFFFNYYVTFGVCKLSPATFSFAGNFNKSVGIVLSLLLLEGNRPHDLRGFLKVGAVFGNIIAFTAYNMIKKRRK